MCAGLAFHSAPLSLRPCPVRRGQAFRSLVRASNSSAIQATDAEPKSGPVKPDKYLESMRNFSEQYARRTETYFCVDKSVTAVVIKGLAEHKEKYGSPLCPCRHYDDKAAEVAQGFWNCPCVPMRERKECHCMLFLTADNDFRGPDQTISREEIRDATAGM